MSTKILQGAEVKLAQGLLWRPAPGLPVGSEKLEPAPERESHEVPANPPAEGSSPPPPAQPAAPAPPPGPGWDEFRALEQQLAAVKARIPELENRARVEGRAEGKAEGRKEGFSEGKAEAEKAAQERWGAALDNAARSVEQITSLRGRLRKEAERDVVNLSLAIARRILRRELTVDPEAVGGLVRAALDRVEAGEIHRVRVRPEDVAAILERLGRIGGSQKIDVAGDGGLEAGGLIVETARGQLDVSVETQLGEIERGFADLMPRPEAKR